MSIGISTSLTLAQLEKLDGIAQADDLDWDDRRRVTGFVPLDAAHVILLLRTYDGRVQTVMPSGRIGIRGPRRP